MKNFPYLFVILALSYQSLGFQALADNHEELRLYDVEVIIFKNDKGPRGHEYIFPVSSPRVEGEVLDLSSPASIREAQNKSYSLIPLEDTRLSEVVLKIVESERYSLLSHVAWRQPGLEAAKTLPIWIKGGRVYGKEYISIDNQIDTESLAKSEYLKSLDGSSSSSESSGFQNPAYTSSSNLYELEGTITVSLSRYLHTRADLVLRKPRLTIDPGLEVSEVERSVIENLSDSRILNNHSLKESRRMRSNKLHYLDNPEFSLLILITPYEAPADELPASQQG